MIGHLLIRDGVTKEVIVNQREDQPRKPLGLEKDDAEDQQSN